MYTCPLTHLCIPSPSPVSAPPHPSLHLLSVVAGRVGGQCTEDRWWHGGHGGWHTSPKGVVQWKRFKMGGQTCGWVHGRCTVGGMMGTRSSLLNMFDKHALKYKYIRWASGSANVQLTAGPTTLAQTLKFWSVSNATQIFLSGHFCYNTRLGILPGIPRR